MNVIPRSSSDCRKGRILGEEAVAGMHSLRPRALDHEQQLLDVQVALGRRSRAEQVRLVGSLDMDRISVELGVDGHGCDPKLLASADYADGDLAPVGNQYLREHRRARTLAGCAAPR